MDVMRTLPHILTVTHFRVHYVQEQVKVEMEIDLMNKLMSLEDAIRVARCVSCVLCGCC